MINSFGGGILKIQKNNRETWLRRAYEMLRKGLLPEAPREFAIGWGFPSRKGLESRNLTIGECWTGSFKRAPEGNTMIMISPTIDDPVQILDVLLHEMIHGAVPDAGHRRGFSQIAKRVGLVKPWTATSASPELAKKLRGYIKKLGRWPAGSVANRKPREKGRQLKVICLCDPPRILRLSKAAFMQGPITCGLCSARFKFVAKFQIKPRHDQACEVARFWRERKSGDIFEIVAHQSVANEGYHRIVLHPQKCPLPDKPKQCSAQTSIWEHELVKEFQIIDV
jgi:hypothetical protein